MKSEQDIQDRIERHKEREWKPEAAGVFIVKELEWVLDGGDSNE